MPKQSVRGREDCAHRAAPSALEGRSRLINKAALFLLLFVSCSAVEVVAAQDLPGYLEVETTVRNAYAAREQLLRKSTGTATVSFTRSVNEGEAERRRERMKSELGYGASPSSFSGANVTSVTWYRKHEKYRYDIEIGLKDSQPGLFLPRSKRVAANQEVGIYYDLRDKISYLKGPPLKTFDLSSSSRRFDVLDLYEFRNTPVPDRMKSMREANLLPSVAWARVNGSRCVRLEYVSKKNEDHVLKKRRTTLWLDPSKAYALVKGEFESDYFYSGKSHVQRYSHEAGYVESKSHPGTWVIMSLRIRDDGPNLEKVAIDVRTIELGVELADEVFTFRGMGVPDGMRSYDSRQRGKDTPFTYDGRKMEVDLNGIRVLDSTPEMP